MIEAIYLSIYRVGNKMPMYLSVHCSIKLFLGSDKLPLVVIKK